MTIRKKFYDFVKGLQDENYLPFPISKTAFSASVVGKSWATDVTNCEIRDVFLDCDCIPSVILGEKEWFPAGHNLSLEPKLINENDEVRNYKSQVETPYGTLEFDLFESIRQSITIAGSPLKSDEDFNKILWYIKKVRNYTDDIKKKIELTRNEIGENCLITFFIPQPYELYCIFSREEAIYMEYDYPEEFLHLQKEIFDTVMEIIPVAIESGADLILYGSVGTELYSPDIFEKHLLNPSIAYAEEIRKHGGISSFHLCGKGWEYLQKGYFEKINVDIVEGLALYPTGDIKTIKEARGKIPENIIIRGSIDLDFLLKSTSDQVYAKALDQISQIFNKKHIVSGGCDILYGTPPENIKALSAACNDANIVKH